MGPESNAACMSTHEGEISVYVLAEKSLVFRMGFAYVETSTKYWKLVKRKAKWKQLENCVKGKARIDGSLMLSEKGTAAAEKYSQKT
jgi:hypothetical protein